MSFLVLFIPLVLKCWIITPLGGKNGSKAMWKCSYCFHLYSRLCSALLFHIHTSVSRQLSSPSAIRSCASENNCSLKWLHSVKGKHTLCPNLLVGLCVLFPSTESIVLRSQRMQLPWTCEQTQSYERSVLQLHQNSFFFWMKKLQKELWALCYLQSNWSWGCLCSLTFCKRKGESFCFPLTFLTTSTETSAKPPTSLLMTAAKPRAAKSSMRFTARSAQPLNLIIRTALNLICFTALQVQVEEAAIQNARLTLQHGKSSWETAKVFRTASWFIRNNTKVDTTPTFHPTRRFITSRKEMWAPQSWIPAPTSLPSPQSLLLDSICNFSNSLNYRVTWQGDLSLLVAFLLWTSQVDDIMIKRGKNKMQSSYMTKAHY